MCCLALVLGILKMISLVHLNIVLSSSWEKMKILPYGEETQEETFLSLAVPHRQGKW